MFLSMKLSDNKLGHIVPSVVLLWHIMSAPGVPSLDPADARSFIQRSFQSLFPSTSILSYNRKSILSPVSFTVASPLLSPKASPRP